MAFDFTQTSVGETGSESVTKGNLDRMMDLYCNGTKMNIVISSRNYIKSGYNSWKHHYLSFSVKVKSSLLKS